MPSVTTLNPTEISEVFYLDRDNNLRWARKSGGTGKFKKGDLVKGSTSSRGYNYLSFTVRGIKYQPKRAWIVWVLTHGFWPARQLDHIDGNPSNDSPNNLRDINQSQNLRNNPSERQQQIIGIHYDHRYKKPYGVQFSVNNKTKYFGRFYTEREAESRAQEVREGLISCE